MNRTLCVTRESGELCACYDVDATVGVVVGGKGGEEERERAKAAKRESVNFMRFGRARPEQMVKLTADFSVIPSAS